MRMAPRVFPTAAPRGAPAAKVANAMDLIFDGGNAWASIPSWVGKVSYQANGVIAGRAYASRDCCRCTAALDTSQNIDGDFSWGRR